MDLDAFRARLGISQGRIESDGAPAFVLGDATAGHLHELTPGDYAEVSQVIDLTDVDLIRLNAELHVPESTPEDYVWTISLRVAGAVFAKRSLASGERVSLHDLLANVSKAGGPQEVALRLTLEEV